MQWKKKKKSAQIKHTEPSFTCVRTGKGIQPEQYELGRGTDRALMSRKNTHS